MTPDGGGRSAAPPWQFLLRAAAVITGLTLLLIVDVHGVTFYIAWSLIVLALVTEGLATVVYWHRSHNRP
jgi:cytochrome c oxidase subunit IV